MSSFSNEDLDDRIIVLQSDLKKYSQEITNYINSLYSTRDSAIDLKNDPRQVLKILKNDTVDLLQKAKTKSEFLRKHQSDMEDCERLMGTISIVAGVSDTLCRCETTLNSSDLKNTCGIISEMDVQLVTLPAQNSEYGTGAACITLRREARLLKSRFSARLKRLFSSSVQIESGQIIIYKRLKGIVKGENSIVDPPIFLSDILNAIILVGNITETLSELFIKKLFRDVILPIWKDKKPITPHISVTDDCSKLIYDTVSRDTPSTTLTDEDIMKIPGACRIPFPSLLEQLIIILSFVYAEALNANDELAKLLSQTLQLQPVCFGSKLHNTLLAVLPKTEAEVLNLQRNLEKPCRDFQKKLYTMNLADVLIIAPGEGGTRTSEASLESDASLASALLQTVVDLPILFAESRRKELLFQAREMLLSDYHNCMLATGDAKQDDPSSAGDVGDAAAIGRHADSSSCGSESGGLRFESCLVSLASCRLLRLMHEALGQACMSSPRLANLLYQCTRDMLELFLAIVPLRFSDVIDSVPRMGALFYNDCVYIAHNCTLISHTFQKGLGEADPSLAGAVGLVDFIPRFRASGDACLTKHLEEQKLTIAELLERINIRTEDSEKVSGKSRNLPGGALLRSMVRDTEIGIIYNSDEAAAVVVRHFERLRGQWRGVLQETVYERLLGHLLEGVCRHILSPILLADCISEAAASKIAKVMLTVQKAKSVLIRQDEESVRAVACSWSKFVALGQLLEYTLAEIAEGLPRRKFASFTANELSGLVKALFEESVRRQSILNAIMQMAS